MDFTMDFYFRQFWNDPRLVWDHSGYGGMTKIVNDCGIEDKIWSPDTFFVNSKAVLRHESLTRECFLRILNNGDILLSKRLTAKVNCPMDLQLFPFDSQLCSLEMESFSTNMSDLYYGWNDGDKSVQISYDASLPQFKVMGHRQKLIEARLSIGNYSRLAAEFLFQRCSSFFVVTKMVPLLMMVIIPWFSFWVDRQQTGIRIGLPTVCLFFMSGFAWTINEALPQVIYTKAVDVLTGNYVMFGFLALLVQCLVGLLTTRFGPEHRKWDKVVTWIDRSAIVGYPLLIILFNIIYFSMYTNKSDESMNLDSFVKLG